MLGMFLISFAYAGYGYNNLKKPTLINEVAIVNYTEVNVNNSNFLQGLTPQEVANLAPSYWNKIGTTLTPATSGDDVEIDGDLNVTGNVTADYFFGNASQMTGLPIADNSSWNESHANTLYRGFLNYTFPSLNITSDIYTDGNVYVDGGDGNGYFLKDNGGTQRTAMLSQWDDPDDVLAIGGGAWERIGFSFGATADAVVFSGVGDITASGDLNVTGNITITDTFCFTADCSAKMYHNGSGIIISS